jgi:exonuclease III
MGISSPFEFEDSYVIGTYVVNAGRFESPFVRQDIIQFAPLCLTQILDAKKPWNCHFEAYIDDLDKKKPVIWGGNFKVAPTFIDLSLSHGIYSLCDVHRPEQREDKLEQDFRIYRN